MHCRVGDQSEVKRRRDQGTFFCVPYPLVDALIFGPILRVQLLDLHVVGLRCRMCETAGVT